MRRALAVPVGIGLVLLAFGAAFAAPADDLVEAPFPVTGRIGDELVSQHHVVAVHEVALAEVVDLALWEGTTSGVWLVVDATIASRVERMTVDADLFLDGVRYSSSGRPGNDVVDNRIADAGFPVTGTILFELPADVQERPGASSAVLRISPGLDSRLDSVVELRIDLTALDVQDRVERERPKAGER